MDIVYYRKCAEIMLRDGGSHEVRAVAARVQGTRNPSRRDKRLVKAWMYRWIDEHDNPPATTDTAGDT